MITIIVPLDFSVTSLNAAYYAANMYKGKEGVRLILFHFYNEGDDIVTAGNFLSSIKTELETFGGTIETVLESGDNFIDSLAAIAQHMTAYMIVMGLTGKTPKEQRFAGSNTLKISEKEICPVLIIPEEVKFNGITNVLITSELKTEEETPTHIALKRVLDDFKPQLHILNVDPEHYIQLTTEFKEERDKMAALLSEYRPEFYFMRLYDFHESVELFTQDKNIDLIIIAPRYHSFFERLFKTQHTKKLIYQSKVPVLTIHE